MLIWFSRYQNFPCHGIQINAIYPISSAQRCVEVILYPGKFNSVRFGIVAIHIQKYTQKLYIWNTPSFPVIGISALWWGYSKPLLSMWCCQKFQSQDLAKGDGIGDLISMRLAQIPEFVQTELHKWMIHYSMDSVYTSWLLSSSSLLACR